MGLQPYIPKTVVPAASSGSALTLVGEILLSLAAPEIGVPALLLQLGTTLANPEKFAAYMSACADFTFVVKNSLEIYKHLVDLGFITGSLNSCDDVANALYLNKGTPNEVSIAQILNKALISQVVNQQGQTVEIGLADSIRAIYGCLFYHLDNTTVITMTDALARLVLTGVVKTYQGIPQSPENP